MTNYTIDIDNGKDTMEKGADGPFFIKVSIFTQDRFVSFAVDKIELITARDPRKVLEVMFKDNFKTLNVYKDANKFIDRILNEHNI